MNDAERKLEKIIGERLRRRRVELGLTQEQLASDLDISYQQIQKYERGANRISATRLLTLARRLDVPITFFYEGFDPAIDQAKTEFPAPVEHGGRQRASIEIARHSAEVRHDQTRLALSALVKAVVERQA